MDKKLTKVLKICNKEVHLSKVMLLCQRALVFHIIKEQLKECSSLKRRETLEIDIQRSLDSIVEVNLVSIMITTPKLSLTCSQK